MSNQIIVMSDFGKTLAMQSLEVKLTLLKIYDILMIKSDLIDILVSSMT